MMKQYLLTLLILTVAGSACSGQDIEQAPQEPASSLIGAWKLTAYGPVNAPTPAVEGVDAGLTFSQDGKVSGNSGCNGLGGDYSVKGNEITFGEFVSTLMACEDPIMKQEDAAHRVLTGTATYEIEGDTLTITNKDLVLVLARIMGSAEETAVPLTGVWRLTSYGTPEVMSSALADVEAQLLFDADGTVTGSSGCNAFGGNYTVQTDQITFREIASTLKLCDAPLMGQEEAIQQVLTDTASFVINGNTLTITNNDRVLVLKR